MTNRESKAQISDETFDQFLADQGMLEDAEEVAIKRVLAWKRLAPPGEPHKPTVRLYRL